MLAKVDGLNKVQAALKAQKSRAEDANASVVVGYTQAYAVFVHENLQAVHTNGTAKYLEQPARELQKELAEQITAQVKGGRTVAQALLLAGLRIQRESQKLVPVLTGALKGSAFTRLEKGRS